MIKLLNNYFILRHGCATSIKEGFVSCWPEKRENPLTEEGKNQIKKIVPKLKKEKIDLIFSSDILRCRQTSKIIGKQLKKKIIFDRRLREVNFGIFNGKSVRKWNGYFKNRAEKFIKRAPGAENQKDIKKRLLDFIRDINKKYKSKNILVIGHGDPLIIFQGTVKGFSEKEMIKKWEKFRIKTGEYKRI